MNLVRLTVNLNEETAAALKGLAADQDITVTEAVRRAVGVYKYITDEIRSGRQVRTMDPDERHQRELVLLMG